ncbi:MULTISPECIES: hypothetical protein [Undibacterium]|uniref:hypothetical protein n=1 Tax=Undibacterium TaxID=401469 RepID=UPI001E580972|nr:MULTISPECIES: hypothetical protein [Undibacterium]
MSNHYHLVVHVDVSRARSWLDQEVGRRWAKIFSLPLLVDRYLNGELVIQAEISVAQKTLRLWRDRLRDLFWFMRALNEPIARRANEEDQCTGRFWEGRFKSQAVLDEAGLLACCVYVDLNPVRAGIAKTPELSDFTSIQQRLMQKRIRRLPRKEDTERAPTSEKNSDISHRFSALSKAKSGWNSHRHFPKLHRFANDLNADPAKGMPFRLVDYIVLVDWTSRVVRKDKKHAVDEKLPPILSRLGFTRENFEEHMQAKAMRRGTVIGQLHRIRAYACHLKKRCVVGVNVRVQMQVA